MLSSAPLWWRKTTLLLPSAKKETKRIISTLAYTYMHSAEKISITGIQRMLIRLSCRIETTFSFPYSLGIWQSQIQLVNLGQEVDFNKPISHLIKHFYILQFPKIHQFIILSDIIYALSALQAYKVETKLQPEQEDAEIIKFSGKFTCFVIYTQAAACKMIQVKNK